jgi:HD superfamily phosphohydrolase
MLKNIHEIRDPIHVFIKLDSTERKVLDSRPFQRLRYIRQLATTYLLYPSATHTRFEHSLGVMELASRVFDVITNPENIHDTIRNLLPEMSNEDEKMYWRRVLRMAALCHDIGHLPFSHASEEELLPSGWNHECFTRELIQSEEMESIWRNLTPPLRSRDIVKLAVGPKGARDFDFTDWETILSETIVGDSFGADRMDYLLRDSYHTGVAYGKFDHYRLIDTLRILPPPTSSNNEDIDISREPSLGVEEGGLQSAEALLLARYFMFTQVYLHRIRRIYDIHLRDFLCNWLPANKFSTDLESHLSFTDNEVITAIREVSRDSKHSGFKHAQRIVKRNHFKLLYTPAPEDIEKNPESAKNVYDKFVKEFGEENVRFDCYKKGSGTADFPVLAMDGRVNSSLALSDTLKHLPEVAIDYIFVDPNLLKNAKKWLKRNINDIIALKKEEL